MSTLARPIRLDGWYMADPARLEVWKWVAVVCMFADHLALTILPSEQWLRQLGHFSYPFFTLAFGVGLHASRDPLAVARRLVVPAAVAQVSWFLIDGGSRGANVLVLCAACAFALYLWRTLSWSSFEGFAAGAVSVLLGALVLVGVEGGVLGVAFIFGGFAAARGSSRLDVLLWLIPCAVWFWFFPSVGAALAFAVFGLVPRFDFQVPRVRGLLAFVYAGHLALLSVVVQLVRHAGEGRLL